MEQADVGHYIQITFVVTTKNNIHIIEVFRLVRLIDVDEHGHAMTHGHAVTAAVNGVDFSAMLAAVDVDIHEGVRLDRFVIVSMAILDTSGRIVSVTATIDSTDLGIAADSDIGLHT